MDRLLLLAQTTPPPEAGKSWLDHIASGGPIGFAIIGLSLVAVTLAMMQLLQVRQRRLTPPEVVQGLDKLLSANDIRGAIRFCQDPVNDSFLARMFASALTRCSRSAFGLLELRSALEEAGQEQISRLHRATDGIGLIAAVAPMLGLLGTVVGMVGAFETISFTEGFARPDQLAGDISVALITTVLGLIVAIPSTAAYSFFRNRIDHLAAEAAEITEELSARLQAPAARGPGQATAATRAPAPAQSAAAP
ncbi:MAG: MotA/TolQ/ExbB proton channel family protein [Phycisphaerales bacterium JB039]